MAYIYSVDPQEEEKKLVTQIYIREKDIAEHTATLSRFEEILKDKTFVGSTLPDGTTFRQKIEEEIPILVGRIAECQKLIDVELKVKNLPSKERIDEIVGAFNSK